MTRYQRHFERACHARGRQSGWPAAGLYAPALTAIPRTASRFPVLQAQGLARVGGEQYPASVDETASTGFGSLIHVSAQPRRAAFLCVSPLRAFFNGWALVGTASAVPGAYVTGLPTLPCARPPHLEVGSGITAYVRGRTMRQSYLTPTGQNPSLIQSIIRDALRTAATADTYQSALDATGAALLAISALVGTEVRHG